MNFTRAIFSKILQNNGFGVDSPVLHGVPMSSVLSYAKTSTRELKIHIHYAGHDFSEEGLPAFHSIRLELYFKAKGLKGKDGDSKDFHMVTAEYSRIPRNQAGGESYSERLYPETCFVGFENE